jgi:hypothetical protein
MAQHSFSLKPTILYHELCAPKGRYTEEIELLKWAVWRLTHTLARLGPGGVLQALYICRPLKVKGRVTLQGAHWGMLVPVGAGHVPKLHIGHAGRAKYALKGGK